MPTRPTKPAQSKGLRFHRFYTQELAVLVFWIVVVAAVAVVISRAEARPAMFFTVTAAMLATVLVTRARIRRGCEGLRVVGRAACLDYRTVCGSLGTWHDAGREASVGYSDSLRHSQRASMRTVIAIALTLAANAVFASQVYKCKDANGTVVFSQRPCADDPARVETVDTSRSLKTGTGGSVEEQSEFAAMNEIRRKCAARLDGISGRYAAQRASIARQIAALEASIERTNNNLAGATAESGLRQQIGSLSWKSSCCSGR